MTVQDVIREMREIGSCHIWNRCKTPQGYGQFHMNRRTERVHRHAYASYHGLSLDDIRGLVIRHICDNPSCANPLHLLAGNHMDNVRDRVERGRSRGLKGAQHNQSKLTEKEALSILCDPRSQRKIADEYGVHQATVWKIKNRKRWLHVSQLSQSGGAL